MNKYHDFKIGDKVKIARRVEYNIWGGTWNKDGKMDWTLGETGEITRIMGKILQVTFFENDEEWNYHYECLQKVNKDPSGLEEVVFKMSHFDISGLSGLIAGSWNKILKEEKMVKTKILNLYSVYVVNKNTEEILVDKRTVIGSDKTEIECSVRDELIRKDKDLKSSDLIFKIETITSWEVEIEK